MRVLLLLLIPLAIAAGIILYGRNRPQDVPWQPLDLRAPIGNFTGRKLAGLTRDVAQCHTLLDRAGVAYTILPRRRDGESCGYADAVRLNPTGDRRIGFAPPVAASCSVAAALTVWERRVVQPAALRHFGHRVTGIRTFGTYNCRRIGGGREGGWSEHARARAIDIAGFTLSDGHRVAIAADWTGTGRDAAFLREVRDGACRLFATVLSPDYNAAHRDHLHLDQAARGETGWRACR